MKFSRITAITFGLLVAASAQAQRPKSASQVVPPNLRPPAGMCRIWLDGVPPARQPAPTDCASALRNRPPTGQVIFGDDYAHSDSDHDHDADDSPLKGVAPLPKGLEKSLEPRLDSSAAGKKPGDQHRKPDKPDTRKKGRSARPDSNTVASLPLAVDSGN